MAATYAAVSDVQARLTYETIDGSSNPNTTQVTAWLEEGEAFVLGSLRAAGLDTSYDAGSTGFKILTSWIVDYAEARVRIAWASAAGDGNPDGQDQLLQFKETLAELRRNPILYGEMLSATGAVPDATQRVRTHVTDRSTTLQTTKIKLTETF